MKYLKYILGIGLGLGLMYMAFRDVDWKNLQDNLAVAHYEWLIVSLLCSLFSHFLRALRWKMLLDAAGHPVSIQKAYSALLVGYMANNAVPRLGEVARCSVLIQPAKIPFLSSAATVVVERAIDVICLALLILLALFLESEKILSYFDNTGSGSGSGSTTKYYILTGIFVIGIIGLVILYFTKKKWENLPIAKKIMEIFNQVLQAATSVFHLKTPYLFWLYTILIWLFYTFVTYFALWSLEPTKDLSFGFSFILMIMGGIGMTMPVPGGLGPFHNAIIFTFGAFGYSRADGQILALLIHTPQFVMLVCTGAISYFYLLTQTPKENTNDQVL